MILLATVSDCLLCGKEKTLALLRYKSLYMYTVETQQKQQYNHALGFGKWILVLFIEKTIYRAILIWLSSDHNDIEYYTLSYSKLAGG